MFMRPDKFGLTTCREVLENCIGFQNIFRPNKPLKFAVLSLFGDFPAEIWIKQKLHNTSRSCFHVMKLKALLKNTFLKTFTKLTLVSNFTVNELFPATISWSNTTLLKAFSDDLAFFRHGLSVFTKLNLMLLTSVNIRNRRN